MKILVNKQNPQIRITAPEIEEITSLGYTNYEIAREGMFPLLFNPKEWVLVEEEPEVELEEFTEKMDAWKARFNHPDDIPIKATMAFTARMFYQYPNVARQWYEQLPKVTMDFKARNE